MNGQIFDIVRVGSSVLHRHNYAGTRVIISQRMARED
jgi:hypothetical protein